MTIPPVPVRTTGLTLPQELLLGELASSPKERNCRAWLRRAKRRLLDPTAAALSRAELVSDASVRRLDVTWLRRYRPLEDPAAEQLRSRLRLVLAGGAAGDDRTLMLGLLLDAGGLLGSVVPELSFLHRRERMKEVLAQVWEGVAVKHAVVAVRRAIQEQQASGAAAASG